MNALEHVIIDNIRNRGPITFESFMDMALYRPELGYYAAPDTIIGRKGDFYTSPHLHPVFGAVIGKVLIEMWQIMGKPADFHVVEMGAGAGYLCKDILDYLHHRSEGEEDKSDLLDTLNFAIIEPYAHVQKRQADVLAGFAKDITWVKSLKEYPAGITGCIFSNELLDAFPVHLMEMEDTLMEIYVGFNGKNFVEEKREVSRVDLLNYIGEFAIDLQHGYRTEINLRIKDWLDEINMKLANGFLLTIDYGYSTKEYYAEERSKGTLLCYHKHQCNEDPYRNLGKQDITAHVNFSSQKKWGEEIGLITLGYCSQGTFLTASGIDAVITELYADSADYMSEISKIKGLILPQGMGESHRVIVQYKGEGVPELRGFSMRNQRDKL